MGIAVLAHNSLFRAGLVSLLGALGFARVVEASSLEEVKQLTTEDRIEILLFHLPYPGKSVSEAMNEIRSWRPDVKIVFLSQALHIDIIAECFAAGATGYLLENLSRDALQQSLKLVLTGEKVFPSELASIISDLAPQQRHGSGTEMESDNPNFSDRELEILQWLVRGDSNKVIAGKLDIAESTVKVHLKHILRKTHSLNRTQAALWAVRRGIVAKPDKKSETSSYNHNLLESRHSRLNGRVEELMGVVPDEMNV
jgi:two-component system nitrate/nitrite response regulator NarL